MVKSFCYLIILFLVFTSCKDRVPQGTEDRVAQSPFARLVTYQMDTYMSEAQEDHFRHSVRSFYMDGDSISLDSLILLYKQEEVAAIFSDIVLHRPKKEVYETKDGKPVVIKLDSSGQVKSRGRVEFHYRYLIQAYSYNHLASHGFSPTHVQLLYNKYNNLFMSLSSVETGAMDAIVYDKKSGHRLGGFKEDDYAGSFYVGNLTKIPVGVDTLSVALKVGEQIYHQDFAFAEVIEDGAEGQ